MRMRTLVLSVAIATCISACTSGSDPDESPSKPKIVAPADALAMKGGRDFDVVAILPEKIDGQFAYYEGVSSDGMVYGSIATEDPDTDQPVGPGSMLITTRGDVILIDPQSGKVTHVSDGKSRTRPTAVGGIDVNADWVTWLESGEGEGGLWTLYSYERSTGVERKLGSYKDAIKADAGAIGGAKISGNRAVMSTNTFGDEIASANQVLSAPLDGSAPLTELAGGATWVDADADGINFIDVKTETLTFRDVSSGETKVLNVGKKHVGVQFECQLFHSRVLMTCEESDVDRSIRVKLNDGKPVSFGPFEKDLGYVDLDTGWAKFVIDPDDEAKIYAIDIKRMKLYKVADTQGGWTLMGNGMALVQPFNGAKGDIKLIKLR